MKTQEEDSNEQINIEDIMQEIRQQILAKKDIINQDKSTIIPVTGTRLPPDFYERLYQASLVYDQIGIKMHVTKVKIPIIGQAIENLRTKLHELVLFYVDQLAAKQIQFNTHILHAVSLLAQELEAENHNQEP